MTLINSDALQNPIPPQRFSLLALGFRPFFLLAGIAAIGLMLWWVAVLLSLVRVGGYYSAIGWHSHEMIFGFATAVLAGFLLTAVRNWTGVQTLKGMWLAALVGLWLAARVLPLLVTDLPPWLIAAVDLAFLPLLTVSLAVPILRGKKRPQLIFIALLALMFLANLLVHLELLGVTQDGARSGIGLGINTLLLIITIMAGRVLPMFTKNGAPGAEPRRWPWLEKTTIAVMLALLLVELVYPAPWLIAVLAASAVLAHAARLWGWYSRLIWAVPLLWVLHLGYSWLVLGFVLKVLATLGMVEAVPAMHAFAAAISVLCLGMMSRVALGHTARPLVAAGVMAWAFVLINLAMAVRVWVPIVALEWGALANFISAGLWLLAFAVFVFVYMPILSRARLDGQPG